MLFYFSLLAAGLCLCLLIYLFLSPGAQETEWQDQEALGTSKFRLFLPWISVLSNLLTPFLTWKYQLRLNSIITQAGLSGEITPRHIAGLQFFCALMAASIGIWLFVFVLKFSYLMSLVVTCVFFILGALLPLSQLQSKARLRKRQTLKGFPFVLDMTTLCVESGMNLHGALIQTTQSIPDGPLRQELRHALNEMRAGATRTDALRDMAERIGLQEIKQWVASISQTESLGMGLGPMLRAQADQRRSERFLRAEKLALEAPVKMLLPLVVCIFPCTFIVLAFPIGMKLLNAGL